MSRKLSYNELIEAMAAERTLLLSVIFALIVQNPSFGSELLRGIDKGLGRMKGKGENSAHGILIRSREQIANHLELVLRQSP